MSDDQTSVGVIGWLVLAALTVVVLLLFAALCGKIALIGAVRAQEIATSDPSLICGKVDGMSYSRQHRKLLLEDERKADFARYGVPWSEHRNYELDHVVPLCLGGADTPKNRRPQRCDVWKGIRCVAGPAASKDVAEQRACEALCHIYQYDYLETAKEEARRRQALFANWKDW